ncbi:ORF1058 [White spot syndrome virus]|uniref:ORF1058 n=1 Tax=White spot syndrome virus TaxID=342409 RepID=A0A2D3I5H6_9VIRU|nr:ORF1058 [White spot syndrome virus]
MCTSSTLSKSSIFKVGRLFNCIESTLLLPLGVVFCFFVGGGVEVIELLVVALTVTVAVVLSSLISIFLFFISSLISIGSELILAVKLEVFINPVVVQIFLVTQ